MPSVLQLGAAALSGVILGARDRNAKNRATSAGGWFGGGAGGQSGGWRRRSFWLAAIG
jgi:hypothetical protein